MRDSEGRRPTPFSSIETVVNRLRWIPSKNHSFTANIDATVQSYQANPVKKLAGTGLVVVDQAYYPLCCGTSWSSINRKGDVVDNLELDVKACADGRSGADLSGFLPEKEFYAMDYPKWKGEGFYEFFDEETYRIWDKDTGFPKGFRDILLRTFRNRVIIPSEIHGRSTSFEIPQFNIVDPIGKQFLDLIEVIAELISNKEIWSILAQFCCEGEDTPKKEYLSGNTLDPFVFKSQCQPFQESDEDRDRFEAYQDSISKLPLVKLPLTWKEEMQYVYSGEASFPEVVP
ncbi:hypothetical protein CFP56_015336 [Quercus suber]|uniref:Uncharacterized protein n=1 Tax=Quercus suber TaxID=58331 RepID=A0AAW0KQS4_QUESU